MALSLCDAVDFFAVEYLVNVFVIRVDDDDCGRFAEEKRLQFLECPSYRGAFFPWYAP